MRRAHRVGVNPETTKLKTCYKCKEDKEKANFYKNTRAKDQLQSMCKKCFTKNTEDNKDRAKQYYEDNKERLLETSSNYHRLNRSKALKRLKAYNEANKERYNEYYKEKAKTNPLFALKRRCYRLTRYATASDYGVNTKTFKLIGVSHNYLMNHLENKNKTNLNLKDRSSWTVDHIMPLNSAKTKEELISLCHYTNLQPMSFKDNRRKGKNTKKPSRSNT